MNIFENSICDSESIKLMTVYGSYKKELWSVLESVLYLLELHNTIPTASIV